MISFTSILTTIKSLSLAAKMCFGVGMVAVVAGGTAGTVAIINANKAHEETQIVASSPNDDNSPSEQKDTQIGEAGGSKDGNNKTEQTNNSTESVVKTENKPQTTTQKPSNSTSNNQPNNTSSASKPSTPTAKPSQPSQPPTPSQPAQPAKKPDYNLNDKYIISAGNYEFYSYEPNLEQCKVVEQKFLVGVTKFDGSGAEEWRAVSKQYSDYAKTKGYNMYECIGLGSAPITWQYAVDKGIALDEAKCAQYGLSCGRW